jgi:hypothetical protein
MLQRLAIIRLIIKFIFLTVNNIYFYSPHHRTHILRNFVSTSRVQVIPPHKAEVWKLMKPLHSDYHHIMTRTFNDLSLFNYDADRTFYLFRLSHRINETGFIC